MSKKFIQRSRELRKNQTEAEAKFWSVCRNNNLGFKFRRQQTIDNTYIADFVCLEKKLIIELDGGQHCESKYDEKRDKYLMQNDFRVVRFWNDEILNNIDGCVEVVLSELSHPHLASPVEGEGQKEATSSPLTIDVSTCNTFLTSPLTGEVGELGSSGEGVKQRYKIDPEQILSYIYAVLHSQNYRTKYLEFLKIDFARIPFDVDIETFEKLSNLGQQLIDLHLLKTIPNTKFGEAEWDEERGEKNYIVEKIYHENDRLYFNKSCYFANTSEEIYNFKIGGYQVLDKYLKSRKGLDIFDDLSHIQKIIKSLQSTIEIMQKIDLSIAF